MDELEDCTRRWAKSKSTLFPSGLSRSTSIKSFDFSNIYTTIPHDKLKSRLASIIWNSFIFKNGYRRYKYLVLGHDEAYSV